jgi:carbamoyl-phosphate synthase large subunit
VFVGDINPLSTSFYFADDYVLLPRSDESEFIPFLLDFCKQFNVKLIVPTRDEELPLFAENKAKFNNIGTKVMVSDLEAIRTCQNKELFIEFCRSHGFNTPKTIDNVNEINKNDFPLFLKPKIGKGGSNTFKVENFEDLKLILKFNEEMLIQEFVNYPEYTIDLFADFNGNVISAVPRERINVWGGESLVTKTFYNEVIIKNAVKLSKALDLKGHITIQCFFNGKEIKFIEINPRFGGAASLSFRSGANSPELLVKLLNGEKIEPILGKFKDGLVALRYVEDFFINEKDIK